MKKFIASLLALLMLLSMAGCGGKDSGDKSDNTQTTPSTGIALPDESTVPTGNPSNDAGLSAPLPVEEYYSESGDYTDSTGTTWNYDFRIPKLTDDTEAAREINEEITGKYEYYAQNVMENMKKGYTPEYLNIGWYACQYQDVLSVIVSAHEIGEFCEYSVFCYNMASGERYYGNDDLLQKLGISELDALDATRRAAQEYFVSGHSALSEAEREQSFYLDALARTLSNEYVRDGAMLYLDDDGTLTAVLPVASLAGADWYYRVLPLSIRTDPAFTYPENCAPSYEDAAELLLADADVQAYGAIEGMSTISADETMVIAGESCTVVYAGTDHQENFVREYSFAVSSTGAIYQYDVIGDAWIPANTLASIYSNWAENVLFAVFTDPNYPEYWYAYDGVEGLDKVMLVPMCSGVNIRVERVEYDEQNGSFAVLEALKSIYPGVRGQCYCLDIQPSETIANYRIVAELGYLTANWYATYDGADENGASFVFGLDSRTY